MEAGTVTMGEIDTITSNDCIDLKILHMQPLHIDCVSLTILEERNRYFVIVKEDFLLLINLQILSVQSYKLKLCSNPIQSWMTRCSSKFYND